MQLDLFAHTTPPPRQSYTVDPDGPVVQGEPHEMLTLPHPRLAWPLAEIQLHRHEDGRWMWGVTGAGGGYKVGPKWGKFAATRDDARRHAAAELLERIEARTPDHLGITPKLHAAIRTFALQHLT